MKSYAHYGFKDFFIALGYKGEMIKRYFLDYSGLVGSMTINLTSGAVMRHETKSVKIGSFISLIPGETATGGRVKRLEPWLSKETFCWSHTAR